MVVGTVRRHTDWAMVNAKIGRWFIGLALAPLAFRFFGSVGVWLDLVHLASVVTWFTGTAYTPVRVLHIYACAISWVVSLLVGACVAGLWAGVYTLNRGGAEHDHELPAAGDSARERV